MEGYAPKSYGLVRLDPSGGEYVGTYHSAEEAFSEAYRMRESCASMEIPWQYIVLDRRTGNVEYKTGVMAPDERPFR